MASAFLKQTVFSVDIHNVELNLCPSCNAFVNTAWETCAACGVAQGSVVPAASPVEADEAAPIITYAPPEPVSTDVEEPVSVQASAAAVVGNETEGFTVGWAVPGDSTTTAGTWTPNTEDQPVQIAWPSTAPTFEPVEISKPVEWPGSPSPAVEKFASPSFYIEPPEGSPLPEMQLQTFQYDTSTFANILATTEQDGRLRPELPRGAIIGIASVGALLVLIFVALFVVGSTASDDTDSNGDVSAPPIETTTTTPAVATPAPSDKWITYTDPEGRFTVSLPTEPTVSTTTNGQITTLLSLSADGKSSAVVAAQALPTGTDWRNNQQVLKNALNAGSSSSGMTVKGQYTGTESGTLHLDALLSNSTMTSNVRFFVSGNTLYGLSFTSSNSEDNSKAFDTLTKSFEPLSGKKV